MAVNTSSEDYVRGVSDGFVRGIASKGVLTVNKGLPSWVEVCSADDIVYNSMPGSFGATGGIVGAVDILVDDIVDSSMYNLSFGGAGMVITETENINATCVINTVSLNNRNFCNLNALFGMSTGTTGIIDFIYTGYTDRSLEDIQNGAIINIKSDSYVKNGSFSGAITATSTNHRFLNGPGVYRKDYYWNKGAEPEVFNVVAVGGVYLCTCNERDFSSLGTYCGSNRYEGKIYFQKTVTSGYYQISYVDENKNVNIIGVYKLPASPSYSAPICDYNGKIYMYYSSSIYECTESASTKLFSVTGATSYCYNLSIYNNMYIMIFSNKSANQSTATGKIVIYDISSTTAPKLNMSIDTKYRGTNIIINDDATKIYIDYFTSSGARLGVVELDVSSGTYSNFEGRTMIPELINGKTSSNVFYTFEHTSGTSTNSKVLDEYEIDHLFYFKFDTDIGGTDSGPLNLVLDLSLGGI